MKFYTIKWLRNRVSIIDQRMLPEKEVYLTLRTYREVRDAVKNMAIRGAPAIGAAAAFGAALGALQINTADIKRFKAKFFKICSEIAGARPTARNLFWALERMKAVVQNNTVSTSQLTRLLVREAVSIADEDVLINKKMGYYGQSLVPAQANILTHCNAGALATVGYGTALGVMRAAVAKGKKIHVYADETRPFLQGARLTAWELHKDGIPVTLITDSMAGALMNKGKIDLVIVGADRIALNGDFANKIGTYSLSVLCRHHDIPFYVAAPSSTFDLKLRKGSDIIIEMRDISEVVKIRAIRIAPDGIGVWNPAFDVTPGRHVTAFVTENGIISPPYFKNIKRYVSPA
ncbi:MAG TPA: S-methyl-5-thioribose-1-phosphate isomerase [bacterium]